MGNSFGEALRKGIASELKRQEIDFEDIEEFGTTIESAIIGTIDKKEQFINFRIIKQFILKNWNLIVICLLLVVLGLFILPSELAKRGSSQVSQIILGRLTPLLPALATAYGLWKRVHKWYEEAKLALSEYQQQLKKQIEKKLDKNEKFRKQNKKVQRLESQLEKQRQSIPENIYASLADFISDRLKEGGYDKHLGLMHQVKGDLATLSQKLLPPPSNTPEYQARIEQLKEVFPRGPARVVLYVDDLDRCPPDTVVEVLEAVQLLVKNRLFIAVIAIDERYINRALAKHYQGVLSPQGRPSPADYLEKIIQIPYRVTPITESALRKYMKAQVVVQDSATSGTKFNEFSPQEFDILVKCCQEVDLSPRSLKRLTNVYKLFKVLCRTRGHKSSPREQQAIISLLAFSGRYPELMRDILHDIESGYEESSDNQDKKKLWSIFNKYFENEQEKDQAHYYVKKELKKLKHDAEKLIPKNLKLEEIKDIFTFVRRFSFVGDIGYDADKNFPLLPALTMTDLINRGKDMIVGCSLSPFPFAPIQDLCHA